MPLVKAIVDNVVDEWRAVEQHPLVGMAVVLLCNLHTAERSRMTPNLLKPYTPYRKQLTEAETMY